MKNNYLLAALISISLVPSFVQGQDVTWGPATDIATDVGNSSDVSLNGTLVEAFNGVPTNVLDTTPVVTVNTVDFAPTASLFTSNQSSDPTDLSIATNAGDPEYDAILSVPNFGGGTNPATVTLGGGELVTGNNYEIQIWFVDDRPNGTLDLRETPISDTNGNTVTLNDQFSIGTFTATGPTIDLTVESPGFGQAHITAYQIRDLTAQPDDVLLGDVNLDGVVNFLDISPFIGVLSNQGTQAEADLNQDGAVNFLDISPFILALSAGG